ncbi:MAG: CpsB/CapC family capsule biosynthesis tyrosine phosphatase [Solirubrobacteraceae bacterium]
MSGFVDIHAHLLPGIDDGPDDLEGAVEMAGAAAAAGTETIAATPHLRGDFPTVRVDELAARCQALREAIERDGISLRMVSGAEVGLVWALGASEDQLRLATYEQRGSDLLIETPSDVSALAELLGGLRVRGLRVTLAHPERSGAWQRDPRPLASLCQQGVLLQVDAAALLARRTSPVGRLAERLCREGLVNAIASDGHRAASWRPVSDLAEGVEAAAALVGPARAQWMASDAPGAIIAGRGLPDAPEIEAGRGAGWRRWRD